MQRINEADCEYRGGDWGIKYLLRGPKIDWGVLLLKSRQKMGAHGHRKVEETFYFLRGSPKILVNDTEYRTREGDAFRIDPGEYHDIVNDTKEVVKVVFIKVPYLPEDKVVY